MKFFVNASSFSKKKSHTAAPFFSLFYIFFRKRRNSRTNNFPIISLVGRATQGNIPSISMGRWRASLNFIQCDVQQNARCGQRIYSTDFQRAFVIFAVK